MEEGGIVPPHSVLAPGTALGLLLSRALSSAQVKCIVAKGDVFWSRTKQEGDMTNQFGPVVRSELPYRNLRSLPFGPTRIRPWMQQSRPETVKAGSTTLCMEWPLR